jgi:hypothetical protein
MWRSEHPTPRTPHWETGRHTHSAAAPINRLNDDRRPSAELTAPRPWRHTNPDSRHTNAGTASAIVRPSESRYSCTPRARNSAGNFLGLAITGLLPKSIWTKFRSLQKNGNLSLCAAKCPNVAFGTSNAPNATLGHWPSHPLRRRANQPRQRMPADQRGTHRAPTLVLVSRQPGLPARPRGTSRHNNPTRGQPTQTPRTPTGNSRPPTRIRGAADSELEHEPPSVECAHARQAERSAPWGFGDSGPQAHTTRNPRLRFR